jgi:multicomponent Na+:H+ antiporter subunit D
VSQQFIILAIVWPLIAGVLTSLLPCREKLLSAWGLLNLVACNLLSLGLVRLVLTQGTTSYHVSGFAPPLGIELKVTVFSGLLSWLISVVALFGFVGGRRTWKDQVGERLPQFLSLFFLLVAAFQGLCLSNDAFNLYVMLEISSLATYGLIAFGGGRAYLATFHYIVMGTIGASFYLIGVGYLYIKTGTLNITDLARIISQVELTSAYMLALCFLITGLLLKMAVFPLHFWLPNAYTYAPAAASVLVAPLSTKLAVFLLFRIMMDIFGGVLPALHPNWSIGLVMLASFGILAGTSLALAQRDLKKTFACLIVSEAGYMLGGLWLADSRGTVGALFHLLNDAIATLVLFLVVIAIQQSVGGKHLRDVKGLFQKSPLTAVALILVGFNLIGVPPTSGFFSKTTLLTGAIASGRFEYVVALLLASLGNLLIFFRILEQAFFNPLSAEESERSKEGQSAGALALMAGSLLILLGLSSYTVMEVFIRPVVLF